jgi:hypothetical protein
MDTKQPKFFIIGNKENVEQVLNKLPNKNKLYDNYLYDIKEPFIEYGFFLQKEDETNNAGEFIIVVCPENINVYDRNIFKKDYFKNITALIICNNTNYNDILEAKEIINIMFNEQLYNQFNNINSKDLHYNFSDNNWINRIYYHIEIPFTPSNNDIDVFNFSNLSDSCNLL